MSDDKHPERRARERAHERAERGERMLAHFEDRLDDVKFPANRAEIRSAFHDSPIEVVGEEETIGDVIDRLEDSYESRAAAQDAIIEALGEAEHAVVHRSEAEEIAETRAELLGRSETVEEESPEHDPRREPR